MRSKRPSKMPTICPPIKEAKAALDALKPELTLINEDATKSLEEGLEETLSLHRLRLMPQLKQSFRTTIGSALSPLTLWWHNSPEM